MNSNDSYHRTLAFNRLATFGRLLFFGLSEEVSGQEAEIGEGVDDRDMGRIEVIDNVYVTGTEHKRQL